MRCCRSDHLRFVHFRTALPWFLAPTHVAAMRTGEQLSPYGPSKAFDDAQHHCRLRRSRSAAASVAEWSGSLSSQQMVGSQELLAVFTPDRL